MACCPDQDSSVVSSKQQIDPGLLHRFPCQGPMPRLNVLGGGILMFEKIVGCFDGIRAATQRGILRPGWMAMASAICLDACNPSDIGQLRPCKLGFCPLL